MLLQAAHLRCHVHMPLKSGNRDARIPKNTTAQFAMIPYTCQGYSPGNRFSCWLSCKFPCAQASWPAGADAGTHTRDAPKGAAVGNTVLQPRLQVRLSEVQHPCGKYRFCELHESLMNALTAAPLLQGWPRGNKVHQE